MSRFVYLMSRQNLFTSKKNNNNVKKFSSLNDLEILFTPCYQLKPRLHVAVEYLSMFNHVSTNKTKKQLPLPNPVKRLSTITTTTSKKRASTILDVTVKRFCQLMLGDILLLSIRLWIYF